jgi:beta-carotene/zeaxanthin 4-ketolase
MVRYLDRRQQIVEFFGIGAIFSILHWGLQAPLPNLFLFWILPIVLSSMQLFFFGTYLPHRSIVVLRPATKSAAALTRRFGRS